MVNLKTDGVMGLCKELQHKKLVCFGAGAHFDTIMNMYEPYDLILRCVCIVDNNPYLNGTKRKYKNVEIDIKNIDFFKSAYDMGFVILITCHASAMEVVRLLDEIPKLNGVPVYIGSFLSDDMEYCGNYQVTANGGGVIPKTIHYCWFGGNSIPQLYERYIDSWREKCPDYTIKKWDESNFDVNQTLYSKQAYAEKKWAFVSDYARIKILYDEGGIYLDCDVELLKNLDIFLHNDFYCGFEDSNHVNFGLGFGAIKGHPILEYLIGKYNKMMFRKRDGTCDLTPCIVYQTEAIRKFGFKDINVAQKINDSSLYPTEVFSPVTPWGVDKTNDSAYSIHHFAASWQDEKILERIKQMYAMYSRRIQRQ